MKPFNNCIFIFIIILSLTPGLFSTAAPGEKLPVTFESLYSFPAVSGVSLSPDGSKLVVSARENNVEKNSGVSVLWLMNADGSSLKKITPDGQSGWNHQWVDNGKRVAFLSVGLSGVQVFTYTIADGSIKTVTNYPAGVKNYVWSPTDDGLVFVSKVYPENNSLEYYWKRQNEEKAAKHSGKLYDKLLFRPYDHWDDGTVTHIFYHRFSDSRVIDITPGKYFAPTSHLGGYHDIAFSADGKTVAFTMNTDPVKAVSTNNDIFTVNIDGTGRKRITTGKGCDIDPRFSPDGQYLLYAQMARPAYEADQKDLILIRLDTGKRKNLTASFDRTLREIFWSPDSKYVYFTCQDKGFYSLYRIAIPSGKMKKILGNACFSSIHMAYGKKGKTKHRATHIFMVKSEPHRPNEVFKYDMASGKYQRLTRFTDDFINKYALAKTEVFWYTGARNEKVQGFITFPPGYDKTNTTKKYPMVMLFHGGPEGAYTASYTNYCGNVLHFAAKGYIAVKINPHGSSSYGLKFQEAILGNWGNVDIQDVLKGLDYLLKTYPAIDAGRVGGAGRSYGGFLVNYLNGVTDRFKCFVSIDGIFDQVSNYYTSDELWFPEMEFKGTPLTNPECYKKSSPSTHEANFKTPALVIHGGRDYRVDLAQGISMYTALQRNNIPSRLLVFPDEPHYFRKLQTWKCVYEIEFQWLDKWLKK